MLAESAAPGNPIFTPHSDGAGGDAENSRRATLGLVLAITMRPCCGRWHGAYEEGRKAQGGNVNRWDYGKYERADHQASRGRASCRWSAAYFNIGPVEMSGSSTTIKQTSQRLGPSMRFVADLSNWDHSLNNITIGESGQFLIAALQGSVGRVLRGPELSDAVREGGSEEHAGDRAEVSYVVAAVQKERSKFRVTVTEPRP